MTKKNTPLFLVISVSFLITGNLVGAGILALPINTGLAGFVPSLIVMAAVTGAMYYTSLVLSDEAVASRRETFNYPSLYGKYLGLFGKWLAVGANLLILYGLIIAYLTGASIIIVKLLGLSWPIWSVLLLFFLSMSLLNITPPKIVGQFNFVFVILMWASFAIIVFISEGYTKASRLSYVDWHFLPSTVPILMTAFFFHNIIPHVCRTLNWKPSTIWKSILFGMIIGYLMNTLWMQVSIGALPLASGSHSILASYEHNLPSTVPLSEIIGSQIFITGSMLFALLAIATSYLATGIGLLTFFNDLTKNHLNMHSQLLNIVLSFGPPLAISIAFPDIFLKAVNVVGGVGIAILFGILPCILGIKRANTIKGKALGYAMLVFFLSFLVFEIAQEAGMLKLKPEVEYWT